MFRPTLPERALSRGEKFEKLQMDLKIKKATLREKEEELYKIRRSARDAALSEILGNLKLPGERSSPMVQGIILGYDKVKFEAKEQDGSSHQLADPKTNTTLENEITQLKEDLEQIRSQLLSENLRLLKEQGLLPDGIDEKTGLLRFSP